MKRKKRLVKATPIATALMFILPFVAHADIVLTNGTSSVVNGVTVVDINKANANGISHNIYEKLNVGSEGLIFNNSIEGANTTLAGMVNGNGNLTSGSASIILSEVQSRNRSSLAGKLEVAGDKAHLIIANPSGITCTGCSFVNTDKVTLTTGTPDMQDGVLKGYSVTGGDIRVDTSLKSDSPTAILSRSAVVNGSILVGDDLAVVLGSNYVDADNQVTGSLRATGSRGTYSLDVAKLGGMYAEQITLVSTESGVGVNNKGVIAAGSGGLKLDTNGRLLNNTSGVIRSTGTMEMTLAGELNNSGGTIASDKTIGINTAKNALNNASAGSIQSAENVIISSGALNNTNGKMVTGGLLAVNTNGNTLTNYGKGKTVGISAGIVALETGSFNNNNGQITGGYVGVSATNISNSKGTIDSLGDIDLASSGTSVNNNGGRLRSVSGHIKVDAAKATLNNNNTRSADTSSSDSLGILSGEGGVIISANAITNNTGQILSAGDISMKSASSFRNDNGVIGAEKTTSVEAASLVNYGGVLAAKSDVNIKTTGTLSNYLGVLKSEEGTIALSSAQLDNHGGLMVAGEDITISATGTVNNNTALMLANNDVVIRTTGNVTNTNSGNFGSRYGLYFGMANQEGGIIGKDSVSITANSINNASSRIIADGGSLTLATTGSLSNYRGLMTSTTGTQITANSFNNDYATLYSAGDITLSSGSLTNYGSGSVANNNLTGVIASDANLSLTVNNTFNNYGYISGADKVSVTTTRGNLNNRKAISSANELNLTSQQGYIYNYSDIAAGGALTVSAANRIYNYSNANMYSTGTASISGSAIYNYSRAVMGGMLGLTTHGTVNNNANGIIVGL